MKRRFLLLIPLLALILQGCIIIAVEKGGQSAPAQTEQKAE